MKFINYILSKLGYVLFNKRFHNKLYIRRNDFRPLEQLYYRSHHDGYQYIQVGGDEATKFDPIFHLIKKNNDKGISYGSAGEYLKHLNENEESGPTDLLLVFSDDLVSIIDALENASKKPGMIIFEHGVRDKKTKMSDLNSTIQKLVESGYKILIQNYDLIAYQ